MATNKIRYPLDLTPDESDALIKGAQLYGTNKKALIFSALKIAYGIIPGRPIPTPTTTPKTTPTTPTPKTGK